MRFKQGYFYLRNCVTLNLIIFIKISIFLSIVNCEEEENTPRKMYLERPEVRIEATPVLPREASPNSNFKRNLLLKEELADWGDGSGRGKRNYNLEDFLVWLPSGDGPTDQWQYPRDYDWRQRHTKTVYVTTTKYETVIVPHFVPDAPIKTDVGIMPTLSVKDVHHLGKDIQGSINTRVVHECKVYHVLGPIYHDQSGYSGVNKPQGDQSFLMERDNKGGTPNINKDFNLKDDVDNIGRDMRHQELPNTVELDSIHPIKISNTISSEEPSKFPFDVTDLVHSSMEYLGPSTIIETPYTDLITPFVKIPNEKSTTLDISIFVSSYYDMRTFDIDSTNINYVFPTLSTQRDSPPTLTPTVDSSVNSIINQYPGLEPSYKTVIKTAKIPKILTSPIIMPTASFTGVFDSKDILADPFTPFFPSSTVNIPNQGSTTTPSIFDESSISTLDFSDQDKKTQITTEYIVSEESGETSSSEMPYSETSLKSKIDEKETKSSDSFTESTEEITYIPFSTINSKSTSPQHATDEFRPQSGVYSGTDNVNLTQYFPYLTEYLFTTTKLPSSLVKDSKGESTDAYSLPTTITSVFHGGQNITTSEKIDYSTSVPIKVEKEEVSTSTEVTGSSKATTWFTKSKVFGTEPDISDNVTTLAINYNDVIIFQFDNESYTSTPRESTEQPGIMFSTLFPSTRHSSMPSTGAEASTKIKYPSTEHSLIESEGSSETVKETDKPLTVSFTNIFIKSTTTSSNKETTTGQGETESVVTTDITDDASTRSSLSLSEGKDSTVPGVSSSVPCMCDKTNATTNDTKKTLWGDTTITFELEDISSSTETSSSEESTSEKLEIPLLVTPSPSNNVTVPVDKSFWIRTILLGIPDVENTIFKSKMQKKLTKIYKTAYNRRTDTGTKNSDLSPQKLIQKENVLERRRRSIISKPKKLARKFGIQFGRSKRQTEQDIYVRLQNVSYFETINTTELIYSVFKDDVPILATEAVEMMSSVNASEAEELLGYPIQVKAEEYIRHSNIQERNGKVFFLQIFALLVGISGLLFLTFALVFFIYKRYSRRSSSENLKEESEASSPRGPQNGGTDNLGYQESHDEESTPEEGNSVRLSPDVESGGGGSPRVGSTSHLSSTSSSKRGEKDRTPRSTHSARSVHSARSGRSAQSAISGNNYASIEDERTDAGKGPTDEPVYSTPSSIPLSQRQANIETALQHARHNLPSSLQLAQFGTKDFIPGTSLPKFLPPPPKTQFTPPPSTKDGKPELPERNYSLDESQWPKLHEDYLDILPSQVEEPIKESLLPTISRASSDVEISTETSTEGGIGLGRLRRRFHDLLDDAFSLMHGHKQTDKVTQLGSPYHSRRGRQTKSAIPTERPNILDELEGKKYIYESAKSSHHSRRPMSAAAAYHAYEPLGRLRTGSIEVSPRSAWGDQITPVNLPHSSTETRPDSAPIGRSSSRRMRTPTPVDLETGLKVGDPALPLIQAIKEELRRFKSSVNTNTSDA
ncbi:UNVERIFIED_CONTAM: hypothetical protein RMT77_008040 [Armadillidium vulgare]